MINKNNFYKNFLLLLLIQTMYGFCYSTFFLFPKFLTIELKAAATDIGNLGAAYGLAIMAGYFVIGKWIDRYGRKVFVIFGAVISILSSFCFVLIDRIGILLYILRIMQGFTFAFIFTSTFTLVADICPPQHLGRMLGYFGMSMLFTNGVAPYIFEPIADKYGWDIVFISTAIFSISALVITFFIKENKEPDVSQKPEKQPVDKNDFPLRKLISIIFALIAAGSCLNIMFSYYQPFALKIGFKQLSGFFLGFTISALITRLFLSGLSDRFGRRGIAAVGLIFYGTAAILMVWLQTLTLGIIGAILGLAHGLFFTSLNAYAIEGVSKKNRGKVMAFYNAAFNLGSTLGVWLVGPVIEMMGYDIVFISSGIFVYLGIVVLMIKKY